jgi:hypothetical protein
VQRLCSCFLVVEQLWKVAETAGTAADQKKHQLQFGWHLHAFTIWNRGMIGMMVSENNWTEHPGVGNRTWGYNPGVGEPWTSSLPRVGVGQKKHQM